MKKVTASKAADLCGTLDLSPEARRLIEDGPAPAAFLDRLTGAGLLLDAIGFLARALPKREGVWWACVCARETADPQAPETVRAALQAAEAWVYKPQEDIRRKAMAAAEAAGFGSPESWAAVGAFWSGGSIAPPEAPMVAPGEDMTPRAVAGAVMLAAVRSEPERAEERHRLFLAKGRDIADGGTGRDVKAPT